MRELFRQVAESGKGPYPYLAVAGALIIPDICGAMDAPNGRASRPRYIDWFDSYVAHLYTVRDEVWLTGADCYRLRCSLLHQGTATAARTAYGRFIFVEHQPTSIHMNLTDAGLQLGIPEFTQDMAEMGLGWLYYAEQTPVFQKNYSRFLRRYPNGLPGSIVGVPVIA